MQYDAAPVFLYAGEQEQAPLAETRSRHRGCFASLCMTAWRRACFAVLHHPSIGHSERSEESPVQDHAHRIQRAKRRPSMITPRGMLRFALHDSVTEDVLRRLHHPRIGHSERSEDIHNLTAVIPNAVRNPPDKIMLFGYSGQNAALARSRPGGCFASLCMTAWRRKCFAVLHPTQHRSFRTQ